MQLLILRPTHQLKGSWLFITLVRIERLVYWLGPALSVLLGGAGLIACVWGWLRQSLLLGFGGGLLVLFAIGVTLLWSEYDWWLFKLSPQKGLNVPLK